MMRERNCPECGSTVAADSPEGLCPRCLLRAALKAFAPEADPLAPDSLASAGEEKTGRGLPPVAHYFGDYVIENVIGQGGMGVVYKARQVSLNRPVALKMIRAGPWASEEFIRRFRLEAEAAANLRHPNIVTIFEIGEHEGQQYYTMDYIQGPSLAELLRGDLPPIHRAAGYVKTVAEAMDSAHAQGILHRDLKPSNVLIDGDDRPRITDFGLAKRFEAGADLTCTGSVMGTPSYIPPEQATGRGEYSGPASDVYSLGAILYETLTGRPPFKAPTPLETLRQVLETEPAPPRALNHAIPIDLETICLKCLEKNPAQRYGTARALAEELGRFLRGEPVLARPPAGWEKAWRWTRRHPATAALAALLAASLVVLAAGSSVAAWRINQARLQALQARARAQASDARTREQLVHSYLSSGAQKLDEGDYLAALPWFVAALDVDQTNAARAEIHRLRLGTLVSLCPVLEQTLIHQRHVNRGAFSPDGRWVVTASADTTAQVWEVASGNPAGERLRHEGMVNDAFFSPDGHRVATVSADGAARIWAAHSGQPVTAPLPHPGVASAAFSPGGRWLVTAGGDALARVWDAATGVPRPFVLRHEKGIHCVVYSPDGSRILTAGADHCARLWDAESGRTLRGEYRLEAPVLTASFSPDGHKIITGSADGVLRIWDAEKGQPISSPLRHGTLVHTAVFSPDGLWIASAGYDQACVWKADTGEFQFSSPKHQSAILLLAFGPEGSVLSASNDQTVRVWNLGSGELVCPPLQLNGWVRHAAFSPDGRRVLAVSGDRTARIWRLPRATPPSAPAAAPNAPASESWDSLEVWNVQSGTPLPFPALGGQPTRSVVRNGDGSRVLVVVGPGASPSERGEAQLWDATLTRQLTPPLRHEQEILFARFSPDGRRVVTASGDHLARIWDAQTGTALPMTLRHCGWVTGARYDREGNRIVTWSLDHSARIWDGQTGQPLTAALLHADEVLNADFSRDGRFLLTTARNQVARIWDAQTGHPITPFLKHDGPIAHARFAPDGLSVEIQTRDGRVWPWPLTRDNRPVAELRELAWLLYGRALDSHGGFTPVEPETLRQALGAIKTRPGKGDL